VVKVLSVAKLKMATTLVLVAAVLGGAGAVARHMEKAERGQGVGPDSEPRPPAAVVVEKSDQERLQGTWVVVSQEINGELTHPAFAETQFVFADGRFIYRTKARTQEGTYHLDSAKSPKVLDIVMGKDIILDCIYELTDTRLKLCWTKGGQRPRGFDTAGKPDTILFICEKQ
jgi:uncharacterized protein (TIGR03067 family)